MTDDRFTELLNGPLNHPRTAFFMLRLANALRSAVQRCGGAGVNQYDNYTHREYEITGVYAGFTGPLRGYRRSRVTACAPHD
jgi:hypothetical protein